MNSVSLSEAQQNLVKLVHDLEQEREIIITDNCRPVARLAAVPSLNSNVSLRDLKPVSVGAILRPYPQKDEDILGEMIEPRR